MMMIRIGINGFGRIGRMVFRSILELDGIDVVAVNDLADVKLLSHLLKFDSIHGRLGVEVKALDDKIIVGGREIKVFREKNPAEIPWNTIDVDVVVESSGIFRTRESAGLHLKTGVDYVFVSAPMNDPDITILPYINEDKFDGGNHKVISMASCTTNALAPLIKVFMDNYNILSGQMTTIHAYTNDQRLIDAIHKDYRRARAAALNIVPTTTGAAKAIFQIYPELEGRLNAVAVRVPVPDGSLVDLNVLIDIDVTREEVNERFREASETYLSSSLLYVDEPIVSTDVIGLPYLSIFDSLLTTVAGGRMVKVVAWYDNEYGYAYHLANLIRRIL